MLSFSSLALVAILASEPVRTAWILSPSALPSAPEVRSVTVGDRSVVVRSGGVSLKYLGPLQLPPVPSEQVREFTYEIPLHPEPETGRHARVPVDVIGTFVNGLPIYNQFEAQSWNAAGLWHYDPLKNPAPPGLLEQLLSERSQRPALIGFALDGYPIYGVGGVRSSYQLRPILLRRETSDQTKLTPEQYGPDVDKSNPIGTFAEDYQYVSGSGDLDEFNGRFVVTPEYPGGTYAYFLTPTFPYLIGPRYHGRVGEPPRRWFPLGTKRSQLSADRLQIEANCPVQLRLVARDAKGEPIRRFELVHEKPIHLVVVSADLSDFAHIHPALTADDAWEVTYAFPHGGHYRIWADYSLPGEPPHLDEFDVAVAGPAPPPSRVDPASFGLTLTHSKPLRTGEDIPFTLSLPKPLDALQPYLGAWAHVIVIGDGLRSFAHVHPAETGVHTHEMVGPPPEAVHITTSFPAPGLYKLWAQFQVSGRVVTAAFVLHVGAAMEKPGSAPPIPADAVRVRVTQQGYEPATVPIPANKAVSLAFERDSSPGCGSEVVFPSLGIRKALPPGSTVVVQLPPQPAGEIGFACGMGMLRGMLVAIAR